MSRGETKWVNTRMREYMWLTTWLKKLITEWPRERVNELFNDCLNVSAWILQPAIHTVGQSVIQTLGRVRQTGSQAVSPMRQLISLLIRQSITQSCKQSCSESVSQSTNYAVTQSLSQWLKMSAWINLPPPPPSRNHIPPIQGRKWPKEWGNN